MRELSTQEVAATQGAYYVEGQYVVHCTPTGCYEEYYPGYYVNDPIDDLIELGFWTGLLAAAIIAI